MNDFGSYNLSVERIHAMHAYATLVLKEQHHYLSTGIIVAIVIGVVLFLIIIACWMYWKRMYLEVLYKRYFGKFRPG